jgi:hypothetical protein
MSPVCYELFYIPEDVILHSHCRISNSTQKFVLLLLVAKFFVSSAFTGLAIVFKNVWNCASKMFMDSWYD